MLITARGWSCNSGENYIGSGELNSVNVVKERVYPRATKGFNTIYSQENEVIITWKADLRLGGNYKVNLTLSKPELALLFKGNYKVDVP